MIYITGDTHGYIDGAQRITDALSKLKKNDILIVAGDFGFIFKETDLTSINNKCVNTNSYWLNKIEESEIFVFFVDGNHENFEILNRLPKEEMFGGYVGRVNSRVFHMRRGEIYIIDGLKIFCFGGAASIDKHSRIEFIDWWKDEIPNYAEQDYAISNLILHNYEVDYIITHSCPSNIRLLRLPVTVLEIKDKTELFHDYICSTVKFKHWYFGHYHIDKTTHKFTCLYRNIIPLDI